MMHRVPLPLLSCIFAAAAPLAHAQCDTWTAFGGSPSGPTARDVIKFDLDGPGPQPARLIATEGDGARFWGPTAHIAFEWTGEEWLPLGQPLISGAERASDLLIWRGDLYSIGAFTNTADAALNGVARWDHDRWVPGAGTPPFPDIVDALIFNDELVVAGAVSPSSEISGVARWDGAQWRGFGTGLAGQVVTALALYRNELYAATSSGASDVGRLYRWDGAVWQPVDIGSQSTTILVMAEFQEELYVAASSIRPPAGMFANLARWDGEQWRSAGVINAAPRALTAYEDRLIVGGTFGYAGDQPVQAIAAWDGQTWSSFGELDRTVLGLKLLDGELFASGTFPSVGGSGGGVTRWGGQRWRALGPGFSGDDSLPRITNLGAFDGLVIAAGDFSLVGEQQVLNIAAWDGAQWSAWPAPYETLWAFGHHQDQLVVSGLRFEPGGGGELGISLWNGALATSLGATDAPARAFTTRDGDLIAAGDFTTIASTPAGRIARWNGAGWSTLGAGMNGPVRAVLDTPGGLVAAGSFTTAGGAPAARIARWDGSAWQPLGAGFNGSVAALAMYDGDLIAAGSFLSSGSQQLGRIARWDGAAWQPLAGGLNRAAHALHVHRGNLYVGCDWTSQSPAPGQTSGGLVIWNGQTWRDAPGTPLAPVYTLLAESDGLFVGGVFGRVGDDQASSLIAHLKTCPPCAADLDGDGIVDFTDYLLFLTAFDAQDPAADLDHDGVIDFTDFLAFLAAYDSGC